ncbi:MAG: Mitochondrial presequence protease [Icmadophila ericetorum]|nr:Mitochondrial presequence protease [Icmadophila ericetorum]
MLHRSTRCLGGGFRKKAGDEIVRLGHSQTRSIQTRRYATITESSNFPKPGEQLHGFTLKRTKHVPELQLTALHLEHRKTGAEYIHIARDDKNNVFSIGFKTNPPDATGVPHILEHTTLCGSEKYPVRDPFFKMLPRSLSNFMNAFTSSDHTTYPFATTNRKDFNNLMSVYLDSTLHPLLNKDDFAQEGWRVGPENPQKDLQGTAEHEKLVFKGVVYNEMKGQMSDASYLYYIKFQENIFPDINNSGGDPQKMTNLTYNGLKEFHTKNYHPSNAKFFTYGDMPLTDHLVQIGQQLDKFDISEADRVIKLPIQLNGPRQVTIEGPMDPLVSKDMQYKTSTSWVMGDMSDVVEAFSVNLMTSLLLDGYGSPFFQGLIHANLGTEFTPNTGLDTSGKLGIFSIGLTGVKEADVSRVKEFIFSILKNCHRQGFEKSKVDGLLQQIELGLKHKTATFGMQLVQRLQPGWFNGVDPFDAVAWNDTVEAFKRKYAEKGYLEGLLKKYLLNDNTLTFTMVPSTTYGEALVSEEAARLNEKIAEVTAKAGSKDKAYQLLTERELALVEVQEKARTQNLDCLPTVHVADIPRKMTSKTLRDSQIGDVKVQWRETSTNGLTYFRALSMFESLPDDLRALVPLFTDSILKLGTKSQTIEQLEDLIKLKSGGIRASYYSSTSPTDIEECREGLSFSGFALDRNIPAMYDLFRTIIQETNFDGPAAENMIKQLVNSDAGNALDAIASSGHSFARRFAEAGLTPESGLTEQIAGLTQVQHTGALASRSESQGLADVMVKLKKIQQIAIANNSNLRVALACGPESVLENEVALQKFLASLPSTTRSPGDRSPIAPIRGKKTFFPLPYQVYYSAMVFPTVPYVHPTGASLSVLGQLLTHKHMHHEIREKGGAYGGGSFAKGLGGIFVHYSYRDPNPQNTLKIMNDAGRWAVDREWTAKDLEEAKLSVFQGLDAPESVNEEGMTRFLSGIDQEMEQKKREQLLDVTTNEVKDAAQQYLVQGISQANIAMIGEQKAWPIEEDGWIFRSLQVTQNPAPKEAEGILG